MENIKEKVESQNKVNGKWETIFIWEEPEVVYKELMHELIHKKLEQCTYITRIQRIQKYNGFIEIIVNYTGNIRRIYTIKSR